MIFPTLFKKAKTDKIQEWTVAAVDNEIITRHGALHGALQETRKTIKGKNIGRANETTASQQAVLEAKSMWTKKKDKGYFESALEATNQIVFLPMLATDMLKMTPKSVAALWENPPYLQPKMDGVRCLARWNNGKIQLLSRGGKEYNVQHLEETIESILHDKQVLDGELYIHHTTRQDINALVKKHRDEVYEDTGCTSKDIQFWVYDTFYTDKLNSTFEERLKDLKLIPSRHGIRVVPTVQCKSKGSFQRFHKHFVEWGFEGTIIRKPDGLYELGHRSRSLIKYKDFKDDEYPIVGFSTGVGKFEGCVIWKCITKEEKTFDVVPKGTLEKKKQWYNNAQQFLGKMITVKYQGLSNDGIPEFPVGLGIRLEEDMS